MRNRSPALSGKAPGLVEPEVAAAGIGRVVDPQVDRAPQRLGFVAAGVPVVAVRRCRHRRSPGPAISTGSQVVCGVRAIDLIDPQRPPAREDERRPVLRVGAVAAPARRCPATGSGRCTSLSKSGVPRAWASSPTSSGWW